METSHFFFALRIAIATLVAFSEFGRAQSVIDIDYGGTGSEFGSRVADAGDYDGDGYPDRIFGAPAVGKAFLYSGAPDFSFPNPYGPGTIEFSGILDVFEGGESFGTAAIGGVDFDGDGRSEILIGQPSGDSAVHILRGKTGELLRTVKSPNPNEYFGQALAIAGDIDGDGVPEIAIGASGSAPVVKAYGAIHFYSYAKDAIVRILVHGTYEYFPGSTFGIVFVNAGDVDHDGFPELAATISGSEMPKLRLYSGVSGALLHEIAAPSEALGFGKSLAAAGPIGPEGHHVIVVGARDENMLAGAIYRYDAVTGAMLGHHAGPAYSRFGTSLAVTEHPDAPGAHTLLVGAPAGTNYSPNLLGRVFVYDGPTMKPIATLESDDAAERFGSAVAALGNTHGDSRSEFAVGAPQHSNDVGRAIVYSGVTPCGGVKDLGGACIGSFGIVPRLEIGGCPRATTTSTLTFTVSGGPHDATYGLLFLGAFDGSLKLSPICSLKFAQIFGSPILVPILPNGAPFPMSIGSGKFSATATLPATGYAYGFRAQMVIADPGSPFGFSATNGVEVAFSP